MFLLENNFLSIYSRTKKSESESEPNDHHLDHTSTQWHENMFSQIFVSQISSVVSMKSKILVLVPKLIEFPLSDELSGRNTDLPHVKHCLLITSTASADITAIIGLIASQTRKRFNDLMLAYTQSPHFFVIILKFYRNPIQNN